MDREAHNARGFVRVRVRVLKSKGNYLCGLDSYRRGDARGFGNPPALAAAVRAAVRPLAFPRKTQHRGGDAPRVAQSSGTRPGEQRLNREFRQGLEAVRLNRTGLPRNRTGGGDLPAALCSRNTCQLLSRAKPGSCGLSSSGRRLARVSRPLKLANATRKAARTEPSASRRRSLLRAGRPLPRARGRSAPAFSWRAGTMNPVTLSYSLTLTRRPLPRGGRRSSSSCRRTWTCIAWRVTPRRRASSLIEIQSLLFLFMVLPLSSSAAAQRRPSMRAPLIAGNPPPPRQRARL
jgi:hypothetical protein